MNRRHIPGLLSGVVTDRHGKILGRVVRMILTGQQPARVGSIRGLAEVTPALKRCPNCYWLRIPQVGVLRIHALRFDPAPRQRSIFHFKVLAMPLHCTVLTQPA